MKKQEQKTELELPYKFCPHCGDYAPMVIYPCEVKDSINHLSFAKRYRCMNCLKLFTDMLTEVKNDRSRPV